MAYICSNSGTPTDLSGVLEPKPVVGRSFRNANQDITISALAIAIPGRRS
jgi:hypothetical protein